MSLATTFATSTIGTETLDDPAADPALVTRMLTDIAVANRWLGGRAAVRWGLAQLLDAADRGRTFTLLDVGSGAGDLAMDAVRWARPRGITLVPLGLERIPVAARMSRDAGVPSILGCAGALPIRSASVDFVLVSQLVHHLDDGSVVALCANCSRIARRGVVIADLRPTAWAGSGFRLAGALLGLHRTTIDDGVTSIARGMVPSAMRRFCVRAGIENARVAARRGSRVVAAWRTDQ